MGLFSIGEKNTSVTENFNTDNSQTSDSSVGAGQRDGTALGAGATQINYDPEATKQALAAMMAGQAGSLSFAGDTVAAMRDNNTVNAWLQLFGLQTAVGAQGKTASEALGGMERLAGETTAAGLSLAGDVAEMVLGNEGRLLRDNAATAQQAYLTAQSLGNNAQNLGLAAQSAATNLGANAFAAASNLGAQANATALGMSVRNADLLEALGADVFNLADAVASGATSNAEAVVRQVTQLADSSQSRMADLVAETQAYNTDLAKTTATGGASDLLRTVMWLALAGIAAFALRRR